MSSLGLRCAPPKGSLRMVSTNPNSFKRVAVMPNVSAAVDALSALFHKIEAQPPGEMTD